MRVKCPGCDRSFDVPIRQVLTEAERIIQQKRPKEVNGNVLMTLDEAVKIIEGATGLHAHFESLYCVDYYCVSITNDSGEDIIRASASTLSEAIVGLALRITVARRR